MNKFDAEGLAFCLIELSTEEALYAHERVLGNGASVPDSNQLRRITKSLLLCADVCDRSGFHDCERRCKAAVHALKKPLVDVSTVASLLNGVKADLIHSLGGPIFLLVSADRVAYFDQEQLFGREVGEAFPSAQQDLRETGNCMAAECCTAAVFHLMRAAEIALRALSRDRGLSYPHSSIDEQQFGQLVSTLDSKLNAMGLADKKLWPSESVKKKQIKFYNRVVIEFRAFNEVFRKHVSHAGRDAFYDRHQAFSAFNHVRTFMQLLATKISETETTPEYWPETED